MSYKKLGEFIQVVDDRNKELLDLPLLGVSVQKVFIPSIANTVGTDMSKYKILSRNEFTYIPDTSRRGDKIGVALLKSYDKALVSQAYTTFKIIDKNQLLPDYLMMWFTRPEFDRYARYHSIGSVREVFDWVDMCNVELPIPSIEKQREIVAQYQGVANKIKVNEQICEKLETTAQTLYKQWFVDFEFPDEEGKPYKSFGGAMVFNQELEKEIPEGWEVGAIGEFVILSQGIQVEVEEQYYKKINRNRFVRIIDYTPNSKELPRYVDIFDDRYYATIDDVVVIRYGDTGTICRRIEGIIANNLFKVSPNSEKLSKNYIYYFLKEPNVQNIIKNSSGSSTMPAISHGDIKQLKFCYNLNLNIYYLFDKYSTKLENEIVTKPKTRPTSIIVVKSLVNVGGVKKN